MRTKLYLIVVPVALVALWMVSCAPTEDANPLDRPQDSKTAAEFHEENVQAITSNPGYRLP
jgi:hypothetical protein